MLEYSDLFQHHKSVYINCDNNNHYLYLVQSIFSNAASANSRHFLFSFSNAISSIAFLLEIYEFRSY